MAKKNPDHGPNHRTKKPLMLAGGISAAILSGLLTISHLKNDIVKQTRDNTAEAIKGKPNEDKKLLEIPADSSIQIPSYTFNQQPVDLPKPGNLQIANEELELAINAISKNTVDNFNNSFVPRLAGARDKNALIADFLNQVANALVNAHPAIQREMDHFANTSERTLNNLAAHLNLYLNRGGFYMDYSEEDPYALELNLYPILRTSSVSISDAEKKSTIPVLHLGAPLIEKPGPVHAGGLASCTENFEVAYIFEDRMEAFENDELKRYKGALDAKTFKKIVYEDVLRHETTHAFLARKFPNAGTLVRKDTAVQTHIKIPLENGAVVDIKGNFPPIMFQELCGIGAQLGGTESDVPYLNNKYFVDIKELSPTYFLVRQLLPLATLQVAPDSEARREIFSTFLKTSEIPDERSVLLTTTPPFNMEHAREVGRILYRVGHQHLAETENGKLPMMRLRR